MQAGVPRVAIPTPADIANVVTRNLVPVAGVLLFGWSAQNLMLPGFALPRRNGRERRQRVAQPSAPRASTGHSASTFPPRTATIQS